MEPGRYIAFEGAEGCGKSTHAASLSREIGAILTRETGGTELGQSIRNILHDPANTHLADRAEALLTAADRAQHLAQVVRPALAAGQHVISDRSVYSTLAYQGYGRGLPLGELRQINNWAIEGLWPELVILLDVPVAVLAERMRGRDLDRFEQADAMFHSQVRAGFAAMAAADPEHWVVIDGSGLRADVAVQIRAAIHERLGL
jgi:dTMP kinase